MPTKEDERKARRDQIAAFAQEMMNTEPKFHLKSKKVTAYDIAQIQDEDGPAIAAEDDIDEEEDDEVEENDDNILDEKEMAEETVSANVIKFSDSKRHSENAIPEESAEEDPVEAFALSNKIPISHQTDLGGHTKAVTAVSMEPAGNRVVTGSLDYNVRVFDFGGMDQRHRPFKTFEAEDGYPIVAMSHSPSGDRFIVATGSCIPKIFDREGEMIIQFCKGDMYIRDLANTKGHLMEVTGAQWHPVDKDMVLTSSLDGSLRMWHLLGEALFGKLMCKHVLKVRGETGQTRLGATACCFAPDASLVVAGAADGSVQIWALGAKKTFSFPDTLLRPAHKLGTAVTALLVSTDKKVLVSRGDDATVRVWSLQQRKPPTPLRVFEGLPNVYASANLEFSPDQSLVLCGTSPSSKLASDDNGLLCFLDASSASDPRSRGLQAEPSLKITVAKGVSAICVKWPKKTNQIFVSTSAGYTRIFFDPRMSSKGALLTAGRAPKREKDPSDFAAVGLIYSPHSLPLFREEVKGIRKKGDKNKIKDPTKIRIPEKPPVQGPGRTFNTSFHFTKYVMEHRAVDNSRTEDPREALLKMDALTKKDPMFLGRAYQESQPVTEFQNQTFEEEQEHFVKRQKTMH